MICYRDMTFCRFYIICKKGHACERALTDKVKADADAWWGKSGAPIMVHTTYPECFVPFFT